MIELWHEKHKVLLKHEATLNNNIQQDYSLILGQCTDLLQTKLKQQADWETISMDCDGIALIKLIKNIVYWFEDQKFLPLALYNAKANLYALCQGNMTNDDYLKKFNALVNIAKSYDGQLYYQPILKLITT